MSFKNLDLSWGKPYSYNFLHKIGEKHSHLDKPQKTI